MKANAPEKIYLYPSDRAGEEYEDEWGTFPWGEGYVEYTRTDAFIEKACEWLKENASDYCILHNSYDIKELVGDFIAAMKRD